MRLDIYLKMCGIVRSRNIAAECIKAGLVSVNGKTDLKASHELSGEETVVLLGMPHEFVGRGGVKLDFALKHFGVDVSGMNAVDIGASTGGFTDCLLKRGAKFCTAVDSGHGQLDQVLLSDPRVRSLEGFNARQLSRQVIGYEADIAVVDVSFISQTLIISNAYSILRCGGHYIGLVKPQFECGSSAPGKNGVVREKKYREDAVAKVAIAGMNVGFAVEGIAASPIKGGDGNREFLIYMTKGGKGGCKMTQDDVRLTAAEIC